MGAWHARPKILFSLQGDALVDFFLQAFVVGPSSGIARAGKEALPKTYREVFGLVSEIVTMVSAIGVLAFHS